MVVIPKDYLSTYTSRALSRDQLTVWAQAAGLQGLTHLCQRQYALVNCFPSLTPSKKRSSAVQSQ